MSDSTKDLSTSILHILHIALTIAGSKDTSYSFSALGLITLLLILMKAGSGDSIKEIEIALGGEVNYLDVKEALRALNDDPSVKHANAIFGKDIRYSKEFLTTVKDIFNIEPLPLISADQINTWCEKETNGLIKTIIDHINPDIKLIFLDALFFKANWKIPFLEFNTLEHNFTKFNGDVHKVNMMTKTENMKYWKGKNATIVAMNYEGKTNVVAVPVLPHKLGLEGLKDAMDEIMLDNNLVKLVKEFTTSKKVQISIPKVRVESEGSLKDLLKDMGINTIFTNMGTNKSFGIDTSVIDVFQKCVLEIDEQGTEAAAVTGAGMRTLSFSHIEEPEILIFDRPFLFFLIQEETEFILFGSVISE